MTYKCDSCEREYCPKSASSKYCSNACRQREYRLRIMELVVLARGGRVAPKPVKKKKAVIEPQKESMLAYMKRTGGLANFLPD